MGLFTTSSADRKRRTGRQLGRHTEGRNIL
jgi:hypothetical protein